MTIELDRPLLSVDLETTGTNPDRHEAWEVGIVSLQGMKRLYEFPVQELDSAEPDALSISGYYERHTVEPGFNMAIIIGRYPDGSGKEDATRQTDKKRAAMEIAALTASSTMMGCAVQFDMTFLRKLLTTYGVVPAWHHRGLDLGSFAAGVLGKDEPLSSRDMRELVPNEEVHSALGDASWNWKIYDELRSRSTG